MAVDTRNKRMSMIGLGIPVPSVLPDPDGTISSSDRAQFLWLYSGIAIAPIVRKIIEFVVYLHKRTVTTILNSRTIGAKLYNRAITVLSDWEPM